MEGLCCGERDICMHAYVLTHVSHVSIPYMYTYDCVDTCVACVNTSHTERDRERERERERDGHRYKCTSVYMLCCGGLVGLCGMEGL